VEAVAVALAAVVTVGAELRLLLSAGDEGRQPADIAAAGVRLLLGRLVLLRLLLVLLLLMLLMLLRPPILRLRRAIRLRAAVRLRLLLLLLLRLEILLARDRLGNLRRLAVVAAAFVRSAGIVAGHLLLRRLRLVMRVLLPELFLRRGDEAEVMLGMLMVRFCGDVVAHRSRIAGKLQVFLGDVMGGTADLHVRAVRFINSRQRIMVVVMAAILVVALVVVVAVASPHALVLTVSHHGSPVHRLPVVAAVPPNSLTSTSRYGASGSAGLRRVQRTNPPHQQQQQHQQQQFPATIQPRRRLISRMRVA
jgi:hypothetical protein